MDCPLLNVSKSESRLPSEVRHRTLADKRCCEKQDSAGRAAVGNCNVSMKVLHFTNLILTT